MKVTAKLFLGLLTSAALVGACDDSAKKADAEKPAAEAPAAPEEKAEAAEENAEKIEEKAEAKAEGEDPAEAGGGGLDKIGIAECDEYFTKYLKCIEDKMPEGAKETTMKALEDSMKAWKTAAEGPGKDTLAETCKQAMEAAKQATQAMGCEW